MTAVNTEAIHARTPFSKRVTLTNQLLTRKLTNQTPTRIITVPENGGVIHSISLIPLGDQVASVFRLYSRLSDSEDIAANYFLELETTLTAVSGASESAGLAPIQCVLPDLYTSGTTARRGIDLEPNAIYYVGLGTTVANGWNVFIRGGFY